MSTIQDLQVRVKELEKNVITIMSLGQRTIGFDPNNDFKTNVPRPS